ncbi:MAG: DUF4974 domain-containing protein [Flavobacterium sp.]|uniref:FecR family protein n=1 Tax=Flavobacterium sp. TaxID=239 RepID=UPI00122B682E|nr:FecR domain-containing protein [Flavobacterium sp.]RZJ67106.1 MAG: DUF4974 domain-containing protein [Flavobacterium sp.]
MEHLAKWLAGEMTQAELTQFQRTPEFKEYERIARLSSQLKPEDMDEEAMLANVMSREKRVKVIPMYRKPMFKFAIAAVLVIALGISFVFRPTDAMISEIASNGTTTHALLPDQSQIALQSGSQIEYDKSNWEENRSLTLKGEAYFKVAKGKKFDVKTSLGTVTVVGTQFNVRARENRFEVECYEGKVRVKNDNSEVLLTKGQLVIFENGDKILDGETQSSEPEWTIGELRFRSATLEQVVAEIERVYDVDIEIKNTSPSKLTGSLPANDLQKAVKMLCATYSLNAETIDKKIVLSANE